MWIQGLMLPAAALPVLAATGGIKPPDPNPAPPSMVETLEADTALAPLASRDALALFQGQTSLQRYFTDHPDVVGEHGMVSTRRTTTNFLRLTLGFAVLSLGLQFYWGQPLLALLCVLPLAFLIPILRQNPHPLTRETTRFGVIEELIAMDKLPDAAALMGDLSVDQLFQTASGVEKFVNVMGRQIPMHADKIHRVEAQRQLYVLASEWGNWRAVLALNRVEQEGRLLKPTYSLSTIESCPQILEGALNGDANRITAAEILAGHSADFETAYRKAQREKEGGEVFR